MDYQVLIGGALEERLISKLKILRYKIIAIFRLTWVFFIIISSIGIILKSDLEAVIVVSDLNCYAMCHGSLM